jgi:hypothetical protein
MVLLPATSQPVSYRRAWQLFLQEGQKRWCDFDRDPGESSLNQEEDTSLEDHKHQYKPKVKNNQHRIDYRILAGLYVISDRNHGFAPSSLFQYLPVLP